MSESAGASAEPSDTEHGLNSAANGASHAPAWVALTVAIGLVAAFAFEFLKLPLAWLLGPLIGTAVVRVCGVPLWTPVPVRQAGQWVIGVALGLYFTAQVAGSLVSLWWPLILGMLFSLALSLTAAAVFRRAGLDPATAYFSATIGGASEMAVLGERRGADVGVLAAIHSVRVLIVVVFLPFVYNALSLSGTDIYNPVTSTVSWPGLLIAFVATGAGALLIRALRWPNAWMLGPLLVTSVATAAGWSVTALPAPLLMAAQLAIGISLGSRFSPESMRTLRDIALMLVLLTFGAVAVSALFGWALSGMVGLPVATMVLATSPGGIAEMSLTAKLLQLGVPVVTVFHVSRLVFMLLTVGPLYSWLARRYGWAITDAVAHQSNTCAGTNR